MRPTSAATEFVASLDLPGADGDVWTADSQATLDAFRKELADAHGVEPWPGCLDAIAALERSLGLPAAERPAPGSSAAQQALRHLEILGKDAASAWFRSIRHGKGANSRRRGADLHGFSEGELRADAALGHALYVVVGEARTASGVDKKGRPTGAVTDADVTSVPALFVEWDDLSTDDQLIAWQRLGLPTPTLMLTTGGKSVHAYWRLQQPLPPAEWEAVTARLIAHCQSDKNCANPSRVMRLAGSRYIDKKSGQPTGARAEIVHEAPDAIYALAEIAACLPPAPAPEAPAPRRQAEPRPAPASHRNRDARPLEQVRDALLTIPQILPNNGERETFRKLAWSLLLAVREAGEGDDLTLALLNEHSPQVVDAADYLRTEPHSITSASFWRMARDAGWRPPGEITRQGATGSPPQKEVPASRPEHRDPSRREVELRSYSELLDAMLAAVVADDDDTLMELRAETIGRFRRTDAQIEAALFQLHARREIGSRPAAAQPESLDLSRISGMDWLIEGFVPDNDMTLLWGNAGAGKTTAALAMAQAVLQGTGLLDHDHPAPVGNVLFIASDSGAPPLYAAMQASGMADLPEVQNGPQKSFHVWAADHAQGMTAWAADLRGCIRLLHFVRKHQVRLVLIDSCKAVCSGAGLDYQNNQLVTSLLTYVKEVIAPHTAVVWLNHDGTAKHAHAGAKAWKEIPSIVHRIIREENKDGTFVESRRQWCVTKSRMGTGREFYYEYDQGDLRLSPNQDRTGNCLARVVDVLMGAWQTQGTEALSLADLTQRICGHGGPSLKTLRNTLATATRAKHPEVVRAGRGLYRLAPRILDSLKGVHSFRDILPETPVPDCDLSMSRQCPDGTFGTFSPPEPPATAECPDEVPRDIDGTLPNASDTNGSGTESPEIHAPLKGDAPSEPIRSTTEWVEQALAKLKLAPHPMHLPEVMRWLRARDAGVSQRQAGDALERLHREDTADDQHTLLELP